MCLHASRSASCDVSRFRPQHLQQRLDVAEAERERLLPLWIAENLRDVVRHHHERMDGKGYPDQLPAERLPLLTRISAVCDVYDAITSNRPYKAGWDPAESLRHMAKGEGHFDVEILKSLVRVLGIFPVGSLVRLESGFLAVVIERGVHPLQPPLVRVFYSTTLKIQVFPRDVDLSNCSDRIISIESPQAWGLKDLERFWCP